MFLNVKKLDALKISVSNMGQKNLPGIIIENSCSNFRIALNKDWKHGTAIFINQKLGFLD